MFPGNEITKTFKLSKTKREYLINYGLAPFVKDVLLKSINASPYFVILNDKSMSKTLQNEQMEYKQGIGMTTRDRSAQDILIQSF